MKTVFIFKQRLNAYKNFKRTALLLGYDWTVALYILIPTILTLLYVYIYCWINPLNIAAYFPISAVFGMLYLITWIGNYHILLEEADKVYLINDKEQLNALRKIGMIYSVFNNFKKIIFLFSFILPILIKEYSLSIPIIIGFIILLAAWKSINLFIRYIMNSKVKGFQYRIITFLMILLIEFCMYKVGVDLIFSKNIKLQFIYLLLILCVGTVLYRYFGKMKGTFFEDVKYHQLAKFKTVTSMFSFASVPQPKIMMNHKEPLLFKKSKKIFRKRSFDKVLIELFLKSYFRNTQKLKIYVQAVVFSLIIVELFPSWQKVIFLFFYIIIFFDIALSEWRNFINESFIKINKVDRLYTKKVKDLALFLFILPGFIIVFIGYIVSIFIKIV